ncbi:MAG: hypothetical protein K6A77_11480 [Clostridiales bacterium]|nr:hypothetical protein [Clostridiales bacterium]
MIEETILNYLSDRLNVPVLMELPEVPSEAWPTWPERFVVIERVGLIQADHIKTASFAFQSYSLKSLYEAAALDEEAREAVEDMIQLPMIGSVKLDGSYNHTDTRTKRYRYQSVYDIYYV